MGKIDKATRECVLRWLECDPEDDVDVFREDDGRIGFEACGGGNIIHGYVSKHQFRSRRKPTGPEKR